MFKHVVTREDELRALLGSPSERAVKKESATVDEAGRTFIEHSPFLLLATSNAAGQCDVSPKGDQPGFVRVLDERHLVIPDRPGNKRLDGMRNLLQNPHAGLIFLIPGREETLRVNGRASIVRDEEILATLAARGKQPLLAIGSSRGVLLQAFRRSGLWRASRTARCSDRCLVLYPKLKPAGRPSRIRARERGGINAPSIESREDEMTGTERVAAVTGAASGIGRATALVLSRGGTRVALCDKNAAGLAEVAKVIQGESGQARVVELDVSDQGLATRAIDGVVQGWGRLDVLVNARASRLGATSRGPS
jgi:PPOX class probable FMN-dependent enzyme